MTKQQEQGVQQLKASEQVVSAPGAVLKVRIYQMAPRIATSIGHALKQGKHTGK